MKSTLKFALAAMLCTTLGTAAAQTAKDQARNAGLADAGSTVFGLAVGAVEMNPLGPILAIGLKVFMLDNVESLPEEQQAVTYATAASIWSGAAANNICVAASILSGGAFAPVCVLAGLAWGVKTWRESEEERIFWSAEGCPMLRVYAQAPDLKCVYTPKAERMAHHPIVAATALPAEAP